ncbi:MAG: DUF4959 domain-containing protein [Prevotella sp.]
MKKAIFMLLAVLSLFACSDEKELIHVNLADNALVVKPAPGGAMLYYALPDDPDIAGIHVRYNDCYGNPILKTASSIVDSLQLTGFNEATENVPAEVTLQFRNGSESAGIPITFSTLDSDPITFIKSVKVESGWDGFSVNYDAPENVKGLFHIYYLGINTYTQLEDTVLIETRGIVAGGDTIIYKPKQEMAKLDIIIKAEDNRGNIVGQRQWQVEAMQTGKHDIRKIYYANSLEDDNEKVGIEYLTDGDTNGWRWFESSDDHKFYTFISKKGGIGEGSAPMYVDIGEVTPTASVRLYAYLFQGTGWGVCWSGSPCFGSTYCNFVETNLVGQLLNSCYYNRLPCNVDVYASREPNATEDFEHMTWEKIGQFKESPTLPQDDYNSCWFIGCTDTRYGGDATAEDTKALDPKYMEINFMAAGQGDGFRYLKLVFNDTYRLQYEYANGTNTMMKVLTFNELEVYTKK